MTLSKEDAAVRAATATNLQKQDLLDLWASDLTDQDRADLLSRYRDANEDIPRSAWDVVLEVMKDCAEIADLVIPVTTAIQGVYGLSQLGK